MPSTLLPAAARCGGRGASAQAPADCCCSCCCRTLLQSSTPAAAGGGGSAGLLPGGRPPMQSLCIVCCRSSSVCAATPVLQRRSLLPPLPLQAAGKRPGLQGSAALLREGGRVMPQLPTKGSSSVGDGRSKLLSAAPWLLLAPTGAASAPAAGRTLAAPTCGDSAAAAGSCMRQPRPTAAGVSLRTFAAAVAGCCCTADGPAATAAGCWQPGLALLRCTAATGALKPAACC